MSLINDSVTNLIGGVSQQNDKLMYPNQVKEMVNYYPQPIDGLSKRPPLEFVKDLFVNSKDYNEFYYHSVFKDDERYYIIFDGADVKVFDFSGNEKTVYYGKLIYEVEHGDVTCYTDVEGDEDDAVEAGTTLYTDYKLTTEYTLESGEAVTDFIYNGVNQPEEQVEELKEYIASSQPQKDITAATVGDYTFVVNKTKVVAMTDDTYPNDYKNAALIFVRQGDYSTDHVITVNGSTAASYSSTSDVATTKTNGITTNLYNQLVSNLGTTNWKIEQNGSCILLQKKDKSSFTISTTDSNANRNLYAFYESAEQLSVLPVVAPNGFIIKVIGESVNKEDDYYVEFQTTDNSSFGNGTWVESPAPDIPYRLDKETMPHAIRRNEDNTFTFDVVDWSDRPSGDEYSAPSPAFIGNTIKEFFTYKGRLAMLSGDKSYYSDVEDIYSWFKKTTLTELDTDYIEVASNHQMVDLYHSLPFNESLYLFSSKSIYNLKSGDVFSNSTVTLDLSKEYQCSKDCKPIITGSTGMFLFENGNHSRVLELYISDYVVDVREVTDAVPQFLNKSIHKMVANSANNLVAFLSNEDKKVVYMYSYYYSNSQKAQSSWYKWSFKHNVLDISSDSEYLYFIMEDSTTDKIYMSKMKLSKRDNDYSLGFSILLDNRYTPTITDNGDGTLNLSRKYTGDVVVVDKNGNELDIISSTNSYVVVRSSATSFCIGQSYLSSVQLGTIYVRTTTQSGQVKVRNGVLMLKEIDLNYADTGYFKVRVVPHFTSCIASEFIFNGIILGSDSAMLGVIPTSDGIFKVPIISKNEDVSIYIENDTYLPNTIINYDWIGDFVTRV